VTPISVYIHIPFCERRCPYCDFESSVGGDHKKYVDDLCAEIKRANVTAKTIYFGGGTPSFIDANYIAQIMSCINCTPDAEVTIECNPNSVTEDKLTTYKNAGVNRVSIGVQSFDDATLKILGRVHNAKQARASIFMACKIFDNVSIDLIHSVPGGKVKLPRLFLGAVKHVSAYCLTSDKYEKVPDEQSIKQQRKIERRLKRAGFEKYEVSNFARKGFECKHNIVYWECQPWLGFGRGAKSSPKFTRADRIMMGLRMTRGVDVGLLVGKEKTVDILVGLGLLKCENGRVACTERGMLLQNQVLDKLI